MSQIGFKEGRAELEVSAIDRPCSTYYKIFGDLTKGTPVVCLHGGPGAGHDYLEAFAELWPRYGIPVVMYDQIGCGLSTHLPETAGNRAFWQEDLFIDELSNLVDHLRLRDCGFHILAHSFGGSIAPAFAAGPQSKGLQRLVLASATPSHKLIIQSFANMKALFPANLQQALTEAVEIRDFDNPAYKAADEYFFKNFLCRMKSPPPEMMASYAKLIDFTPITETMVGASAWIHDGSMVGWDLTSRLSQISAPTLLYNAEFDTSARDITQAPFFERIPRVRWVTISDGGHMAHLESKELQDKVLKLVGEFLTAKTS
ncbi:proline-specific peptidase [Myriangium duriaei CBS 260.36]|uniref:Proline-specific peptidase n=1 Tax=Myriangium duriaei CBS 260.36 TaxID=1168546 RepID=A0A9P4J5N0_9PEZI|nr:proline-specific peptidase [Myriangium duriaei CBS 260.36]